MASEGIIPVHGVKLLKGTFRNVAYPTPFALWAVQFHNDHPGPLGADNIADYDVRQAVSFADPHATLGTIANSAQFQTGVVPSTEPWRYFTLHDHLTLPNRAFWSGVVQGGPTVASGTIQTIPLGALVCTLAFAS